MQRNRPRSAPPDESLLPQEPRPTAAPGSEFRSRESDSTHSRIVTAARIGPTCWRENPLAPDHSVPHRCRPPVPDATAHSPAEIAFPDRGQTEIRGTSPRVNSPSAVNVHPTGLHTNIFSSCGPLPVYRTTSAPPKPVFQTGADVAETHDKDLSNSSRRPRSSSLSPDDDEGERSMTMRAESKAPTRNPPRFTRLATLN